ncbi:MAG TPA: DUF4412 domain-containing protein [Bacteroidia bacterium]|jgi:hypothetical protein|nr:DUF4412 domain-containing protein [Bacteroidia bacterium]
MKKYILQFFGILIFIIASSSRINAQSFEGMIEFKKETPTDTTNYVYFVKGDLVRIDEIGTKSHKAEGTYLIDMDQKTMKSLNHDRKLYMDQPTPPAPVLKGTCTVKKGEVKNLQGYKCVQYIVTNTEENTQISYWIADGKFSFFEKLLRQLNRKDKSSVYFLQIPGIKNTFPMLSIQQGLDGKEQMRLEVTKITKKEIDSSMFDLPRDYNKFEN